VGHLADRLRVARERAGLSIRDISESTKIRAGALEALERGNFDRLPGDFYVRAFLKAYARAVGLPEEDLLREYDESLAPARSEPSPTPQPLAQQSTGPAKVLRWPRELNAPLGVGLAVVLLVTLVSFRSDDTRSGRGSAGVGGVAVAEAAPAAVATSGRAALPEKLLIEIRPAAPIWVAATADGTSAIYRLLKPGELVRLEASKELSFRIGNAGAFVYSINGVPGKPLGGVDEVREFEITRENYQTYRQ
jgi:transcriptional regulator with XRE-family HTH domain